MSKKNNKQAINNTKSSSHNNCSCNQNSLESSANCDCHKTDSKENMKNNNSFEAKGE